MQISKWEKYKFSTDMESMLFMERFIKRLQKQNIKNWLEKYPDYINLYVYYPHITINLDEEEAENN